MLMVPLTAILVEATGVGRAGGLADVDGVEPPTAGLGPDQVRERSLFVDHHVVDRGDLGVVGVVLELADPRLRLVVELAELGEVKDLHAVVGGLADDEAVVVLRPLEQNKENAAPSRGEGEGELESIGQ